MPSKSLPPRPASSRSTGLSGEAVHAPPHPVYASRLGNQLANDESSIVVSDRAALEERLLRISTTRPPQAEIERMTRERKLLLAGLVALLLVGLGVVAAYAGRASTRVITDRPAQVETVQSGSTVN